MMQWVMNYPEQSPAYVLAEHGYDVWLGNNRGTTYGQQHLSLSPKEKEFWNFSWEEMGTFDCPATIDHILEQTGQENLTYIGHSEGTSQLMAAGTLMPEYFNEKLNLGILLAPPVGMSNLSTKILRF